MQFAVYIVYNIDKRMEGLRDRYLDYFLHLWGLGSNRGNVKPSCLKEIHIEIGTLFPISLHQNPYTGEIVLKFAVYVVCKSGKRMEGDQRTLFRLLFEILGPWNQTR